MNELSQEVTTPADPKALTRLYPEALFFQLDSRQQGDLLQKLISDLENLPFLNESTLWLTNPALAGNLEEYEQYRDIASQAGRERVAPLIAAGAAMYFRVEKRDGWSISNGRHTAVCAHANADDVDELRGYVPGFLEGFHIGIAEELADQAWESRTIDYDDVYKGISYRYTA